MAARDNGGPAFPGQPVFRHPHGAISMISQDGMTLRDYFASIAPVEWGMAQQAAGLGVTVSPADRLRLWGAMAIMRYEYADAMLVERNKGTT